MTCWQVSERIQPSVVGYTEGGPPLSECRVFWTEQRSDLDHFDEMTTTRPSERNTGLADVGKGVHGCTACGASTNSKNCLPTFVTSQR